MLSGGEDHAIVATFPASAQLPARWRVIGEVVRAARRPGASPAVGRVTVDGAPWDRVGGWDHFAE